MRQAGHPLVGPCPRYPTRAHAQAAAAIVAFFAARREPETILLVNSCARGKATPDSCLDITVLVPAGAATAALAAAWQHHEATDPVFATLRQAGRFAPGPLPADEDPDDVELGIGNMLVYAVPLWERGDRLARLRDRWLPYYEEAVRQERLAAVARCCRHHLAHIPPYVGRGLSFQAFARLWRAFQLFLQALFIAHRTYPIAYDKWIREQVVELLGLPDLYAQLPPLFEIGHFEGPDLVDKAHDLQRLLDAYVGA